MESTDLSINGYYLRPTLSYKASTIFGEDPELAAIAEEAQNPDAAQAVASFAEVLRNGLFDVNELQLESADINAQFAAGLTDNIHEVMIAGQKADVALQLATAIRTKVLDAYQEIMRMQL